MPGAEFTMAFKSRPRPDKLGFAPDVLAFSWIATVQHEDEHTEYRNLLLMTTKPVLSLLRVSAAPFSIAASPMVDRLTHGLSSGGRRPVSVAWATHSGARLLVEPGRPPVEPRPYTSQSAVWASPESAAGGSGRQQG